MIEKEQTNPSEISLQFPNRFSRISRDIPRNTSNQFDMETINQLLDVDQTKREFLTQSRISNSKIDPLFSNKSTVRINGRNKKRRRFRGRKKKHKKSAFDSKKFSDLFTKNSDFTEIGNLALQELLKNNVSHKLDEIYSCKESESEDEVVYRNHIGTVEQKIKVSNTNCSCRVF